MRPRHNCLAKLPTAICAEILLLMPPRENVLDTQTHDMMRLRTRQPTNEVLVLGRYGVDHVPSIVFCLVPLQTSGAR